MRGSAVSLPPVVLEMKEEDRWLVVVVSKVEERRISEEEAWLDESSPPLSPCGELTAQWKLESSRISDEIQIEGGGEI